jgi:hypothetical protein
MALSGGASEGRSHGKRRSVKSPSDQMLGEVSLSQQPTDVQKEIDQEVAVEEAAEREQLQKDEPVEDVIASKEAEMKKEMDDADMQREIDHEKAAETSASEQSEDAKAVSSEV